LTEMLKSQREGKEEKMLNAENHRFHSSPSECG
jgi:hypothetical protein